MMHFYREIRTFKRGSRLLRYLAEKRKGCFRKTKRSYRVSTIRLALEEIIREERLYDPKNQQIIVCGKQLEKALDVHSVERSMLHIFIRRQLEPTNGNHVFSTCSRLFNQELMSLSRLSRSIPPIEGIQFHQDFDIEGLYWMKPKFLKVIKEVRTFRGNALSYRNICNALSDYIMENKQRFFDLRNIKVAKVKDTLLADAFGMDYFSRSQVTSLIRSQLKPVRRSRRLMN